MAIAPRTLALTFLFFALYLPARAQTEQTAASPAGACVTVTLTASGVRFAALGSVRSLRLEVFGPTGEQVYSTNFLPGNVRDWSAKGADGGPCRTAHTPAW